MVSNLLRNEATKKVVDSVRDLYTAKITLPLGNPNLKLVHTNQFLFTELPTNVFELTNLKVIAKALNSTYSRYSGYTINRWYIENSTITNDGKTAKMELDVNPFASNIIKYQDDLKNFENSYNDAVNAKKQAEESKNKNKKKIKSVKTEPELKNVKGFSKKDQAYIKKVVTAAFKARNYPKSELTQVFAIYDYYRDHHVYSRYECMKYMKKYGFEGCWKIKKHNCGDGAATMQAMFRCAGITADIFNGHYHFLIRLTINGKYWYCDQSGAGGSHNKRELSTNGAKSVWGGVAGGSKRNRYC